MTREDFLDSLRLNPVPAGQNTITIYGGLCGKGNARKLLDPQPPFETNLDLISAFECRQDKRTKLLEFEPQGRWDLYYWQVRARQTADTAHLVELFCAGNKLLQASLGSRTNWVWTPRATGPLILTNGRRLEIYVTAGETEEIGTVVALYKEKP